MVCKNFQQYLILFALSGCWILFGMAPAAFAQSHSQTNPAPQQPSQILPSQREIKHHSNLNYMTPQEKQKWTDELGRAKKTVAVSKQPLQKVEIKKATNKQQAALLKNDPGLQKKELNPESNALKHCQFQVRKLLKDSPVNFLPGSSRLPKSEFQELKQILDILQRCNTAKIIVEGHSDGDGDESSNQKLSGHRAQTVMDFLINQGVAKHRIRAVGFGEMRPIAPNDTIENRALNRRIEITLY